MLVKWMRSPIQAVIVLCLWTSLHSEVFKVHNIGQSDKNRVQINALTATTTEVSVDIGSFEIIYDSISGFSEIGIEGFSQAVVSGSPLLPAKHFQMVLVNGDQVSVEILDTVSIIREKCRIAPGEAIGKGNGSVPAGNFVVNSEVYTKNEFFPSNPVRNLNNVYYRGVPIALLQLSPVLYNPVTGQLRVFTHMKVRIHSVPSSLKKVMYPGTISLPQILRNTTINGPMLPDSKKQMNALHKSVNDPPGSTPDSHFDVVIITVDSLKPAAERIALWQKRKGYFVHIESRTSWANNSEVQEFMNSFYSRYKPQYLCIIGDIQHVPATRCIGLADAGEATFTDLNYVCFDGQGDYIPDMAKGRISVNSLQQGNMVIDKIIRYETSPPSNAGFYRNISVYSVFEENNLTTTNPQNEEGARKTKTAEEIGLYLKDKGYRFNRMYDASPEICPMWFNSRYYSFGEPIPDYLRRPAFQWNAKKQDELDALNSGTFLNFITRHGLPKVVIASPGDMKGDDPAINNGTLLPFLITTCCSVGKFDIDVCFTEAILRRNDGVAGIVGASDLNNWCYSDAMIIGMVDAVWPSPGLSLNSRQYPDPVVTNNTVPVYTFGDIVNQGLLHNRETYVVDRAGRDFTIYQHQIFHLFGDPTTRLWTEEPRPLTISHLQYCNVADKRLMVENRSLNGGIVTLISKKNGAMIKYEFTQPSISLPVEGLLTDGDTLLITVTAQNYKPYLSEIIVGHQKTGISFGAPVRGEVLKADSETKLSIKIYGEIINSAQLFYSLDSGTSWNHLQKIKPLEILSWVLPDTVAENCLLLAIPDTDTTMKFYSSPFSINRKSFISGVVQTKEKVSISCLGPVNVQSITSDVSGAFTFRNLTYGTYTLFAENSSGSYISDTVKVTLPTDTGIVRLFSKNPLITVSPGVINFSKTASMPLITIRNSGLDTLDYVITSKNLLPELLINEIYCGNEATTVNGIELVNFGADADMSRYTLTWRDLNRELYNYPQYKPTSGTYTFPDNFTLKSGKTCLILEKTGTDNDSVLYLGKSVEWGNINYFFLSVTLKNAEGIAIDRFATKGVNGSSVSDGLWYGEGVALDKKYAARSTHIDSDRSTDWVTETNVSLNKINPGQILPSVKRSPLTLSSTSGKVKAKDSTVISLSVDTSGLADNTIADTILIYHNSPGYPNPMMLEFIINKTGIQAASAGMLNQHFSIEGISGYRGFSLRYTLPVGSLVQLSVYNLQGRSVYRSKSEWTNPGSHVLTLGNKKFVPSAGQYIISLTANNQTLTRRFNYLKN